MRTYTINEITDKLNSYFKSINNGEPITLEQAEIIGHVLMALKDTTPRYPNTLNARVARTLDAREENILKRFYEQSKEANKTQ